MTEWNDLSTPELTALLVLGEGMASRSTRTERDPERWVASVAGAAASGLLRLGLAREVPAWGAVEITTAGAELLARSRRR